jgi:hypothetical protein
MENRPMKTRRQIAEAVMAHALENYEEGGWDIVVEAFDVPDIEKELEAQGIRSEAKALTLYRTFCRVWEDRRAGVRNR